MKRTMVTTFLFLLLAVALFSAAPATGSNVLIRRNDLTVAGEILQTSDQPSLCGGSVGVKYLQSFEPQFAFDGQIAFTLLYDGSFSAIKLFSYSVRQARVVNSIELTQDFMVRNGTGALPINLKVHKSTGLVAVFGLGPDNLQKVLLLASDPEGNLHKLWAANFAGDTLFSGDELAFDKGGSRIYLIHSGPALNSIESLKDDEETLTQQTRSRTLFVMHPSDAQIELQPLNGEQLASRPLSLHLSLLRADDGAVVATIGLPISFFPILMFNEARDQAIALLGESAYVFASKEDGFELKTTFTVNNELGLKGQGFSSDGRYLIAYGSYLPISSKKGKNFYFSFDLDQKTVQELVLEQGLFPVNNAMTFHQPTQTLFVPLSSRLVVKGACERLKIFLGGNRQVDVITLNRDGSLSRSLSFEIPANSRAGGIGPEPHRLAISATGALGFISLGSAFSQSGRILAFDTLTGEIIDDRPVDKSFSSIHLFEQLGLFVSTDATEKLPLIQANTEPVVEEVIVKENRTIIKGFNFLSGARVQINDEDIGIANRTPDDPGRELSINRGKKEIPRGQEFSLVITNRDGLKSEPFRFSR